MEKHRAWTSPPELLILKSAFLMSSQVALLVQDLTWRTAALHQPARLKIGVNPTYEKWG